MTKKLIYSANQGPPHKLQSKFPVLNQLVRSKQTKLIYASENCLIDFSII